MGENFRCLREIGILDGRLNFRIQFIVEEFIRIKSILTFLLIDDALGYDNDYNHGSNGALRNYLKIQIIE